MNWRGLLREVLKLVAESTKDWQGFKLALIALLKRFGAGKLASLLTGFWGWVAGIAWPILFDKLIRPGVQWLLRKIRLPIEKKKAQDAMKKVKDAKTDKEFDDAFDNLP